MNDILQGTTPTLTIQIDPADFAVTDIVALELAVKQQNNVISHGLTDVTIDAAGNSVSYTFTEAETLAFVPDVLLRAQARFMLTDGNICGTDIMSFNVDDFIGSEVLSL